MKRLLVLCVVLCLLSAQPFSGSDLTIFLKWNPQPPTAASLVPKVRVADTDLSLTARGEGKWIAAIPNDGLYTSVIVIPQGSPPTNYRIAPLTKVVPYYSFGQSARIVLAPTKVDQPDAAKTADELFSRDVQSMAVDSLASFLQRSRAVALTRMDANGGNWAQLHGRDVQSVYKFLEAVVVLWKKEFLTVSHDDVDRAREWLHDADRNRVKLVRAALKFDPKAVAKLERELLARDGVLFSRLWNRILNEEDRTRRCTLLDHYQRELDAAADSEAIERVTGVTRRIVLSARAQCAANQMKASTAEPAQAAAARKVSSVRAEIEEELKTVPAVDRADGDVRLLRSDHTALVDLEEPPT